MRAAIQRLRARLTAGRQGPGGFESEQEFWNACIARNPAAIHDAARRARAFPPLLLSHLRRMRESEDRLARVIELGPGPLSLLAWGVEQRVIDVVAIDPLAGEYARLLDEHGMQYPIRPRPGRGEDLLQLFESRSFDAAYASNALDHTQSPQECLRNLSLLVRRGGIVFLEGFCREGTNAGWEGLHQHDLVPEAGRLLHFDRRGKRTDLTQGLGLVCRHESVAPFRHRGIDSFGYEPADGHDDWFAFDWYTLVFEATG